MAAKTAAEDGLKVLLIERKKNITEINRACVQIFYTRKLTGSGESETGDPHRDGYIDPVSVESDGIKTRFHFPVPGFSVDYNGPLRPCLNWVHVSPGGYQINQYKLNDRPWGFYYHKETYLAGLLAEARKAGAEVRAETFGLAAENTSDGVKVRVRTKSGEETLEARKAIAADGNGSKIVESLGLNEKRKQFTAIGQGQVGYAHYIVAGLETGLPGSSWSSLTIPSVNPASNIMIGMSSDNTNFVGALGVYPFKALDRFMNDPRYAHMFRHARIVKKEAVAMGGPMLSAMKEPMEGNVVVIGDAASPGETWIQGATACGYQAVKAIEKELNGQKGYPEYIAWWQKAFAFNVSDYGKTVKMLYSLHRLCSDEEIDYVFKLFQGRLGIPVVLVAKNMELIKKGRPDLYEKLAKDE